MSKVIFMGAGASKPFGYPITNEILPKILERIDNSSLFDGYNTATVSEEKASDLDSLFKQLFPGIGRIGGGTTPIMDILSLIDHSLLMSTNPLPGWPIQNLVRFRQLLEQAIHSVLWREPENEQELPLERFVEKLTKSDQERINIISTNYDITVERKMAKKYKEEWYKRIDFGFDWRDPETGYLNFRPQSPLVHFFKLHGSVSWLRCELCEHVYIDIDKDIMGWAFCDELRDENRCHCGHGPLRSVLITPSLIRDVRDVNLLEVWKHSLEVLRNEDEWVIIGYSFPPEDIAIRSLLIRAAQGRSGSRVPKIRVVQMDEDQLTRSRYQVFFPECEYFSKGLENFLDQL